MLGLVNTAYGVGTFLGPALVGLTGGYSIVFAVVGAGVLVCVVFLRRAVDEETAPAVAPPELNARTLGLVATFALMLLVYEGLEAGVGTWEATDLITLGWSAQFAAGATSVFWGAFTLGRVLTAPLAVQWSPQRILVPAFVISVVLLLGIRARHRRTAAVRPRRALCSPGLPGRGVVDDPGDPQRHDAGDLRDPRCRDRECADSGGARRIDRARRRGRAAGRRGGVRDRDRSA